jgi:hypothetical protein
MTDHKYDPIPTADYYAMAGVFGNIGTTMLARAEYIVDDYKAMSKKPRRKKSCSTITSRQRRSSLAIPSRSVVATHGQAWKVTASRRKTDGRRMRN